MAGNFEYPPYHRQLSKFFNTAVEVRVERDGADVIVGTVDLVVGDGCFIRLSPPLVGVTFVDFRDIRGVTADRFSEK